MDVKNIKLLIREKRIDRRELARKIGIKPGYLNQMLSGWALLKGEYETIILQELERGGKNGNKKRS